VGAATPERSVVIREIQRRVRAELVSESDSARGLNGPLGESIAIASGSFSLDFTDPEHVAEGICNWLDKYFLQSPQGFDPREGTDASPSADVATSSTSKSINGSDGGSRAVAPKPCNELGVSHCPCHYRGDPNCCYCGHLVESAA
jgi:hypothetical protein